MFDWNILFKFIIFVINELVILNLLNKWIPKCQAHLDTYFITYKDFPCHALERKDPR